MIANHIGTIPICQASFRPGPAHNRLLFRIDLLIKISRCVGGRVETDTEAGPFPAGLGADPHQAVAQAQAYFVEGNRFVVDIAMNRVRLDHMSA
jgi:hypothetical protein